MSKTLKGVVSILVVAALAFSAFTGCGSQAQSNAQESSTVDVDVDYSSPEDVAATFIDSVVREDYNTSLACMGLNGEGSYISTDYIKSRLADDLDYGSFVGAEFKEKVYATSTREAMGQPDGDVLYVTVQGDSNDDSLATNVTVKRTGDKWVVDGERFYRSDFVLIAPVGVEITVDGKEVPDKFSKEISAVDSELYDYIAAYELPYVGRSVPLEVTISCDNYTYTKEVLTSFDSHDNESYIYNILEDAMYENAVFKPVDEKDIQKDCADSIKSTWNTLWSDFKGGKSADEELGYFADNADSAIVDGIWDWFKSLDSPFPNEPEDSYDNFKLTKCNQNSETDSIWLTDKEILFVYDYELTWDWLPIGLDQTMQYSDDRIIMSYNGEDCKIKSLNTGEAYDSSSALFYECY